MGIEPATQVLPLIKNQTHDPSATEPQWPGVIAIINLEFRDEGAHKCYIW